MNFSRIYRHDLVFRNNDIIATIIETFCPFLDNTNSKIVMPVLRKFELLTRGFQQFSTFKCAALPNLGKLHLHNQLLFCQQIEFIVTYS
uniref:Uncharacterized protein n=3 Tax=Vibrio TaxID=662 RepID=A0A0H3ZL09_9VIBR|nr:hypothetical protein [Vibrio tasmaniensis]AKN39223.1 hypothetical protein [Vibrio splendidus]AKN39311.1 hypothetical protein [Vibrio sp. FF_286]AKN40033.1 hypothetical protein [Vibrio tasmaniensis]